MKENFQRSLDAVLVHEGGWSNHPQDPGGATMRGVTQRTYNAYRKARSLPSQSVRNITDAEIADIYRARYWDACRCSDLPSGIDYATFDFAVNSGPSRAVRFLQRVLGCDDDGVCGPITIAKAQSAVPGGTINRYLDDRLRWLKTLKTFPTFGKGWTRRVAGVRAEALRMASQPDAVTPPTIKPQDDPAPRIDEDTLAPTQPVGFWTWLASILGWR